MLYRAWFDGFSSPKTHKRAGYIVIIEDFDGHMVREKLHYLPPDTTNNQAEFRGLIEAFKCLQHIDNRPERDTVNIYGDSKLVIDYFRGLGGKNKILSYLREQAIIEAYKLQRKMFFILNWVPRKENKAGIMLEDMKI